jgi:hypothetical protein
VVIVVVDGSELHASLFAANADAPKITIGTKVMTDRRFADERNQRVMTRPITTKAAAATMRPALPPVTGKAQTSAPNIISPFERLASQK